MAGEWARGGRQRGAARRLYLRLRTCEDASRVRVGSASSADEPALCRMSRRFVANSAAFLSPDASPHYAAT